MSRHEDLSEEFSNYYRQPSGWLLNHEYEDEWGTHGRSIPHDEVDWSESDGWRSRPPPRVSEPVDFNVEPLEHNVSNRQRRQIRKDKRERAEKEERELRAENRPLPPRRGRRTPARDDDRDDRYDSRRSGQDSERRHERRRDDHRETESRRSGRDSDRQESGQRGDARDLGRRDSRRQVREISPPRSPGPRQRPPGVSKIFIELFLVIKNPGLMECLKCLHFGKKEK